MSKTSKLIAVHDMPKMKHDGKTISDPVGILEILKGVKSITLEEVGSRPPPPVRRVHVWNVPGHRRRLRPHSGHPHSNGAPQDWQGFFRIKAGEKDIKKKKAQIAAKALTLARPRIYTAPRAACVMVALTPSSSPVGDI
ncbi:hypothetical protein SAMN04488490_0953 [Marinobacter sp. LV10R510-11A]|uniref:hypothetical protein n=1 Tax=Marinobacter sp. LV10R510-11A TaxID=1415568 RepID=UPI000BBF48F5|nr:hypothetical protein [Marinobacter sp. LV10R510-11A]SOB75370.1 hypothetical protein SAMN04488490_0953 [Marinobacter sp. LV10R510-11A]